MERPKRRKYFVDKKVQGKYFFLTTVSLLVLYTLIILTAIFAPYVITISSDLPLSEKAEAANVLILLHSTIWPGVGLVIILFGFFSVFITHRIAGPIYRVKKTINEVARGDLTVRLRLRKRDDLHDLADSVNHLTDTMRSMVIHLKERNEAVSACLSDITKELKSDQINNDAIKKLVESLESTNRDIGETLGKYTTSDR